MCPKLEPDSDPENFYQGQFGEELIIYDKFNNFKKKIKKFRNEQYISERQSKDLFYIAVLYGLIFKLNGEKNYYWWISYWKMCWWRNVQKIKRLKDWTSLGLATAVVRMTMFQCKWAFDERFFFFKSMNCAKNVDIWPEITRDFLACIIEKSNGLLI